MMWICPAQTYISTYECALPVWCRVQPSEWCFSICEGLILDWGWCSRKGPRRTTVLYYYWIVNGHPLTVDVLAATHNCTRQSSSVTAVTQEQWSSYSNKIIPVVQCYYYTPLWVLCCRKSKKLPHLKPAQRLCDDTIIINVWKHLACFVRDMGTVTKRHALGAGSMSPWGISSMWWLIPLQTVFLGPGD